MSPPPRATFLDLPTELLLRIINFQEIDPFTAAQISRRLNSIALAEVFPSLRTKNPTRLDSIAIEIAFHGRHGRDASDSLQKRFPKGKGDFLGLLSIGFDITSIDEFKCRVIPWASRRIESLWALVLAYQRLAFLIRRLNSVPHISFHFDPRNLFESEDIHPEMYRSWVSGINELLNLCIAKGCQDLQVYDATHPLSTDPSRFPVRRKNVTYWVNGIQTFHTPIKTTTLSSEARIASKNLAQFKISSPVLLCVPHISWTSQLLSASSITTLTFEGLAMDEEHWIDALSILVSPLQTKLESLEIRNCKAVPPPHLINFINKLDRLMHLTILYPIPSFHLERKALDLPRLVYVRAPLDLLNLLCVQIPFRGSLFPQGPRARRPGLQTLRIIPRCPQWGQPPCDCTSKVEDLLTIHSHVRNIVWDMEFSTPPNIGPNPDSKPSHSTDRSSNENQMLSSTHCGLDINNPTPPPSYAHITSIILPAHHLSPSFGGFVVLDRVIIFLRALSGLKSIRIVGKNRWQENEWEEMVEETFVKRIRLECPWVEEVILWKSSGQEVVHDLREV